MNKRQPEYRFADELIDAVMDYIAQKWTPSMIRRQLREYFPDIKLKTCSYLMWKAKDRIRERYGISPEEYKGSQIAFYETIIRNKNKIADKLKAAERLDKLFGLENISNIDPAAIVEKILEFKRQAEKTIGGQDDGGSTDDGQRNDAKDVTRPTESKSVRDDNREASDGEKCPDGRATTKSADAESGSRNNSDVQESDERSNIVDETPAVTESIDENLSTPDEVDEELGFKTEE